jgi:branched-chain amino acid transport system substrate-binding protein
MTSSRTVFRIALLIIMTVIITGLVIGGFYFHYQRELARFDQDPNLKQSGYQYIGLVAPLSGPLAPLGESMVRGADMAVKNLNEKRQPEQRPFRLLLEDESADLPENASLANDPRVQIMIGHVLERTLVESADRYLSSGLPVILPVISDPRAAIMGQGRFFQMMVPDVRQAQALGEFTRDSLKPASILVVYEDSDYAKLITKTFRDITSPSARVEEVPFPEDPEELLRLAEQVAAHKPQVIFLALHAHPALYLAQALNRFGLSAVLLGTHALAMNDLASIIIHQEQQGYVTLPYDPVNPREKTMTFLKRYEETHRQHPLWLGLMTYDAVMLAADALKAGQGDTEKTLNHLRTLTDPHNAYAGLVGDYVFENDGSGLGPVAVVKIEPALLGKIP